MSFKDVKAIYDSLPREQQLLVSPRGRFVASPNLVLRTVDPGKGFAEAYKMPGNKAFVTVAVAPDAQGNGKGMELLHNTIARANAEGIGRLVYRLNSNNNASRALVRKFVDKPHRTGKDWEEYIIDTANAPDPYEAELPPSVNDAVESVKGIYKDMGYDLSDVVLKGSTRSRFENGAVVPFSVMPEKQQVGASWVPADNSVYFHPDIKAAMKLYGVKGSPDKFIRTLAAHELAHAVDQRYADDAMRKQVLEEARKAKFTTPYLDNLPFEENRDKEIFAEWLASKVVKNDGVGYNSNMRKTANMVGLEKAAEINHTLALSIRPSDLMTKTHFDEVPELDEMTATPYALETMERITSPWRLPAAGVLGGGLGGIALTLPAYAGGMISGKQALGLSALGALLGGGMGYAARKPLSKWEYASLVDSGDAADPAEVEKLRGTKGKTWNEKFLEAKRRARGF